ncbi:carbohydrate ABC transporter permease [Streptomyces sp. PSKA54]|uniref:Carbohydrate ABC transporter permease n=1 Tax=Streptomyces himalayensis subsp. aureolus TaxID=2758039 RepID=A0A7W2HH84_9ACTN|nr:carbohydrate ABC transporter permease [Streptomyces himalayensis]MBA4863743.1 carbohydrate ABC transporter permease [Streptomyces himalayensis subsp. aureolus]
MSTQTFTRTPIAPAKEDRPPAPPAARRRPNIHRVLSRVIVLAIAVVQVYPLVWLFLTSVRDEQDFASGNPFGLPTSFTLDNYARAFGQGDIGTYILNSLIVTAGADVLIVVCGMMGAYAIEVLGFRFSNAVRALFLIGIIVPVQIALVPLFIDYTRIDLLDTYPSMIIPLAGFSLPMALYLFSSFFGYIPRETYEAASLDGAGPYRIFARITLPMSVNTVVTVVMVNSIFIWNDFIFANTFVLSEDLKTIPLGLQNYIGAMGKTDWTATFAAVCVTVTPLLLVFLVLNKAMIYGLESGANKG